VLERPWRGQAGMVSVVKVEKRVEAGERRSGEAMSRVVDCCNLEGAV